VIISIDDHALVNDEEEKSGIVHKIHHKESFLIERRLNEEEAVRTIANNHNVTSDEDGEVAGPEMTVSDNFVTHMYYFPVEVGAEAPLLCR